jgi:hypothetical protein
MHDFPNSIMEPSPAEDTSGTVNMPDMIRKLAYTFYEKRGRVHGHHDDDWLKAEREIKHHLS